MDEFELEIFRADDRASRGITSQAIADLAASFDGEANPVPACIGHPKTDSPALGTVSKLRVEGNKLFATVSNAAKELVDNIKSGAIINRSAAFFGPDHEANPTPGKFSLRHLGFLGASAPGIPGMASLKKALSFSADGEPEAIVVAGEPAEALIFEAPATATRTVKEETAMDPEEKARLEAEAATETARIKAESDKLASDRAEFAAEQSKARAAANVARVNGLVSAGQVLPAEVDELNVVFNSLSNDELEFAADDKGFAADRLATFLGKALPKRVDVSGKPLVDAESAPAFTATGDVKTDAATITSAARKLMKENDTLSFEAAVEQVQKEES